MKTKMISVHLNTWKQLLHIKAEEELPNFDAVIARLLKKETLLPLLPKETLLGE